MRTFVAEFFYSVWLMREFIIADNQDISKAGMMFLLSKQKEVSLLLEADNKAELIQQLRLYPQAVIILDYTLSALLKDSCCLQQKSLNAFTAVYRRASSPS